MFVDGSRILFIYELNSKHKCRHRKESGDYVYLKIEITEELSCRFLFIFNFNKKKKNKHY
jgi:hypothetical protein